MIFAIGLIIAVIVLASENKSLRKQLESYRKILQEHGLLKNGIIVQDNNVKEESKPTNQIIKEEKKVIEKPIIETKPKYSDKEIKNSSILIVGSILVVLSALIFLTTTWDVTNNIVKTMMLFAMLLVFYVASYIARKINLNQTYKAFHYITLAYIPINLLSLWVFKLIGEYLSIDGEGALLYLSICSFIVSSIYYVDSKRRESKPIGIASILLLLLGVIFIDMKLEVRFETYVFSIMLVGIVLTLLHKLKYYYISESLNIIGLNIILFGLLYIHVIGSLAVLIFDHAIFLSIVNTMLLMYLMYYSSKNTNTLKIYGSIYPLFVFLAFLNLSGLIEQVFLKEIIMLSSFVLVCAYDLINNEKIKNSTYYEVMGASLILYLFTHVENSIPSYTVILSFLIISILFNLYDEEKKPYKMYFISTLTYLLLLDFVNYYDLSMLFMGYITLAIISLVMLLKNKRFDPFRIIGYIVMFLITLSFDFGSIASVLLLELFTIITLIYSINNNDKFNRVVSYIYLNISTFHLIELLDLSSSFDYILAIPLCNALIFIFELLLKNENSQLDKKLLYVDYALSSLILVLKNTEVIHLLLQIITTVLFYYYCKNNNENEKYKYVLYLVFIPFIFMGSTLLINGINYMNVISLIVIAIFAFMNYKTKDNKFTIFYFVYLILNACVFDNNKYLILSLFAVGSLINYILRSDKERDFFAACLYTCALVLSQFIVFDLDIDYLSVFKYGFYMIYAILIIRNIIKKYNEEFKIIEYVSLILINMLAIFNFTSETDGLIFVIFLVFIVILSYIKKYGPVFIVSLIFILINAILLTKEFWLNLPWWLYLLLIGATLIAFAIINELKDNKDSGQLVKKLKDDLDL